MWVGKIFQYFILFYFDYCTTTSIPLYSMYTAINCTLRFKLVNKSLTQMKEKNRRPKRMVSNPNVLASSAKSTMNKTAIECCVHHHSTDLCLLNLPCLHSNLLQFALSYELAYSQMSERDLIKTGMIQYAAPICLPLGY